MHGEIIKRLGELRDLDANLKFKIKCATLEHKGFLLSNERQ